MFTNLKKKTEGFTIIEVLIVLAIAGLILLIVFLAVPALQRNSRNTQRRNDTAGMLGAVQEYVNNNNGSLPPADTDVEANVKLGFYATGDVTLYTCPSAGCAAQNPANKDSVILAMHAKCPNPVPADPAAGVALTYSNRAYAAVFEVETTNGSQHQCQQS